MPDQASGRARPSRPVSRQSRAGGSSRSTCQGTADSQSVGGCPRARRRGETKGERQRAPEGGEQDFGAVEGGGPFRMRIGGQVRPGARRAQDGRRLGEGDGAARQAAARRDFIPPLLQVWARRAGARAAAAARAPARARGDSGADRRRLMSAPGGRGRRCRRTPPAPWPRAGPSVQGVSGPADTRTREGDARGSWGSRLDRPGTRPESRGAIIFRGVYFQGLARPRGGKQVA